MRPRLLSLLLRALLFGPQRLMPPAYELYAALIVPHTRRARVFRARLASLSGFRPQYVYLNAGCALAIDPTSGRVFAASRRGSAMQAIGDIAVVTGGGRGFGYALRIEFADGTAWQARTFVSIEPLLSTEDVLRTARGRLARGEPPLPLPPVAFGPGVTPAPTGGD